MNRVFAVVKSNARRVGNVAQSHAVRAGVGLGALAAAGMAKAQDAGLDVSGLLPTISAQKASVGEIGLAILAVVVAIACVMWIRRVIK